MNKESFLEAIDVMAKAHPCPNQSDRVAVLYKFYGDRDRSRLEKAAELVARRGERFPTPAVFESFFVQTAATQKIDLPHVNVFLSDLELAVRVGENPERTYRGILCFVGGDDSPENLARRPKIFQRIAATAKEMLGEAGVKRVRDSFSDNVSVVVGPELQKIARSRKEKLDRLYADGVS